MFHLNLKIRQAFTLIELLVVVAIIAILAAIAIPNMLEAQVRAKVSRTKNDLRTMATAIESFAVDHNEYPMRRNTNTSSKPQVPQAQTRLEQLGALTSPVSYIHSIPRDVFDSHMRPPNNVLDYYDITQTAWLINSRLGLADPKRVDEQSARWISLSVGPDGYLGALQPALYGWAAPNDPNLTTNGTIFFLYDPTNGTTSRGNIYYSPRGFDGTATFLTNTWR